MKSQDIQEFTHTQGAASLFGSDLPMTSQTVRLLQRVQSLEAKNQEQSEMIAELWSLVDFMIKSAKKCPDLCHTAEAAASVLRRRGLEHRPQR